VRSQAAQDIDVAGSPARAELREEKASLEDEGRACCGPDGASGEHRLH
jgi:hypothetical protein